MKTTGTQSTCILRGASNDRNLGHSWMKSHDISKKSIVPDSGKVSREKTFANQRASRFRGENSWILAIDRILVVHARDDHLPM